MHRVIKFVREIFGLEKVRNEEEKGLTKLSFLMDDDFESLLEEARKRTEREHSVYVIKDAVKHWVLHLRDLDKSDPSSGLKIKRDGKVIPFKTKEE